MRSVLKGLRRRLSDQGSLVRPRAGYSTGDVADYYEAHTDIYLGATGDYLQAFRGQDTNALMRYLVASMGLGDGMNILDAGCGVGAPAIWIATHFPASTVRCVTNSQRQYELASESAAAAGVADRVTVVRGDYHRLGELCEPASFDRVMFIESLGHHHDLGQVVRGAATVLKPGGSVYVKDFFRRYSDDLATRRAIDEAVATINRNYCYNVMQLPVLIEALMRGGFSLSYARQPDLVPDLGITIAFEHAAGRLTYPVFSNVHAVDWFEILAVRD